MKSRQRRSLLPTSARYANQEQCGLHCLEGVPDGREGRRLAKVLVHLRNAPTQWMKELSFGKAYRYAYDEPEAYTADETYFPHELLDSAYNRPVLRRLEI